MTSQTPPPVPPAPSAPGPVATAAPAREHAPPAQWSPPVLPPQNVLAWVAFGLGIGGIMFGVLASIPAIVCGHIARRQVRRRGEQGAGAALTGLILGYAITALLVVGIGLYVLFIAFLIGAAGLASGAGSAI
ncbi:DUF4190 domain-containing protein [Agromyces sp. SYSU T0242]|uniref:DUF4190 domain-containing protein n=1 Tax=Agromyces litoreus TaxID=3158561 RepID=UPI00339A6AB7